MSCHVITLTTNIYQRNSSWCRIAANGLPHSYFVPFVSLYGKFTVIISVPYYNAYKTVIVGICVVIFSFLYYVLFVNILCILQRQRSPHNIPMQAKRGGGGIAPTHSQPDTRSRWVVRTTLRQLYSRERQDTHCTGGCVGLEVGLDCMESLAPTGIRSPNRLARSELLYRLSYPDRHLFCNCLRWQTHLF
jgi:hypothetical protein